MIKKYLLIVLLFSIQSTNAVFSVGQGVSFENTIAEHLEAFKTFEPFSKSISYKGWGWQGPEDSLIELVKYDIHRSKLIDMIRWNAAGNGFLIGILGALLNKGIVSEGTGWGLLGSLMSSALMVYYQNNANEKIPYFTKSLQQENFWNDTKAMRIAMAMVSSAVSYYLTNCAIDCVANKDKKELLSVKKEDSLSQLLDEKK